MKLEQLQKRVEAFGKVIEILSKKPRNFTEEVFSLYLELERVDEVAKELNERGYRTKGVRGERKYISNDITKILEAEESMDWVGDDLYNIVQIVKRPNMYKSWEEKILKSL